MKNTKSNEEKLLGTIEKSKEIYFRQEQNRLLTYWEFLWNQFTYTCKRWWAFQSALLLFAWQIISSMEHEFYRVQCIGVVGCLFVVLIIPELWRNKESDFTQVEAACLYSLRQVYSARITLFGIVDVALLTLFSMALGSVEFRLTEVISQLLLPATVTACICFVLLCGRQNVRESFSLAACLGWCGVWWLMLMNERLYRQILPAVWVGLFALALIFLVFIVRRTVRTTNQYWEVVFT